MNKLHDPELELFKRTVDLADYAKRAGYELRPQDGAPGLTVLDHPNRDRIVVGQHPNGPWIYASVPDYALRRARRAGGARACAPPERDRSLAGQGDRRRVRAAARSMGAPRGGPARPGTRSLAQLSSHGSPPRLRGCPLSTAVPARSRAAPSNRAAIRCPRADRSDPNQSSIAVATTGAPPVENGPRETEVERRLREWREAQAAIDRRQRAAREVQPPAPPAPQPAPLAKDPGRSIPGHPPADRVATTVSPGKSELGRRRYDWTPAPTGIDAIVRGPRGPSGGRER